LTVDGNCYDLDSVNIRLTIGVGATLGRTGLCGEDVLVIQEILDPCHDVVDVCRSAKVDAVAILVDPGVV
jgi:hypothetical protein